jgi:aminopeptidase N
MRFAPAGFCALVAALLVPASARAGAAPAGRIVLPDTAVPLHYDIAVDPDLDALTFKGSASVLISVKVSTDRIVLNSRDIVIERASLSGAGAPTISYDESVQTATFRFPAAVGPGEHVLSMEYRGRIFRQAYGLFVLDYATPLGTKRSLFTQFENADARRFVPCWDEPALKATFSLTATLPSALMPVSNMPVASREDLPGGRQRVRFLETPKMSSYLLFLGAGDFERIHRDVGGVDLGVVCQRGATASAQYALDAAAHILAYYNEYFGTPYPLPKLDLIAGPGSSTFFGAMENWGAIFYFEKLLLFDPKVSTDYDRQRVYLVIAHEMSHQWFGDLVTMQWWDDLWLNEGFASWMQEKATDHFHPEWHVWLGSLGGKNAVMQTDERDGTHAVVTPIYDVLQANAAFDSITYTKGQAVIRMLEAYVGEEAFRAGVRNYIRNHAYGNTVTDDLWREVDAVSVKKLTGIAHDFTLRPGVPMIVASPSGAGLSLSEERFALDFSGASGGRWDVPVVFRTGPGNDPANDRRVVVAAGAPTLVKDAVPGSVVNAGQTGYYRVLYEDRAFDALSDRFNSLAAEDQLGLLEDTASLGKAGRTSMGKFLSLATRLPSEADPIVWMMLASEFEWLDIMHNGLESKAAFRNFAVAVLEKELGRIGFDSQPGEPDNVAVLRSNLLESLGELGDKAVVAEARRRFAAYLLDRNSLSGASRNSVLTVVAINADEATWEELHSLAAAATSTLEKQQGYDYLGEAADVRLQRRAMDLAMTDEAPVTFRPRILRLVAGNSPEMAFDFAAAKWDALGSMVEDRDVRSMFVARLLGNASETAVLERLGAFSSAHVSASNDRDIRKIASTVRDQERIRNERLPEVDRWIEAQAAAR